jgi:hypothetical protein
LKWYSKISQLRNFIISTKKIIKKIYTIINPKNSFVKIDSDKIIEIILFSKNPTIHNLNENLSLFDQVNYIKTLKTDNVINFNKTYDLILHETMKNGSKENIPTNIICLSNNDIKEASFTIDYIHNNPLQEKWQLASAPELYEWSSSSFYICDNRTFSFITDYRDV